MLRIAALACVVLLASPAAARTAPGQAAFVQVDGAVMLPIGSWSDNASFPKESQFDLGPGGRFTAGWAPAGSRLFTVGLEGAWTRVGTSSWERFTARRTSRADADARMWSLMAAGTVNLPARGRSPFAAELHGALGVLVPSGEERWEGQNFDYDFFRPTLAGRLGARGVYRAESWDVWVGAGLLVAPGAVRHVDALPSAGAPLARSRERRTLTALEPGLGLRYWFSL